MIPIYDPAQNVFILKTSHTEKDLAKQVPGATWHAPDTTWRVPASWPGYVAINGIFQHVLQPDPSYVEWANTWWKSKFEPLTNLRFQPDVNLGDGPTVQRLWPLQRVAVQAMVWSERYLVLDDMGGGKTATTLAALKMAAAVHGRDKVFPALIVCPNKVRRSWRKIALEELGDGAGPGYPGLRMEVMPKGKPAQLKLLAKFAAWHRTDADNPQLPSLEDAPQVLVINWEALHNLSRLERFGNNELSEKDKTPGPLNMIPWRTVIGDEVHRAKDRKSRQTLALKAITFGTPSVGTRPARFRWGLSGTLVSENAAEAWSILNWMDDVSFPAYTRFLERYSDKLYNGHGGFVFGGIKPQTHDEFQAAFLPYTIRRLREQFDPFKPQRIETTMTIPMEPKQKTAYNDLAKTMLAALDNGVLTATDGKSKGQRLFQLAQSYGEMVDKGRRDPQTGETIYDFLHKAPSNKVNAVMELVEDFGIEAIPNRHLRRSLVVGALSRQLIGLLEIALTKEKIPYSLIVGGMSDSDQELQERNFELGNTHICLCTIGAAKEGLNSLVKADTLVFMQKSWSLTDNKQFVGRVDRPGQTAGSVTIIDMVSEGTMEEFAQKEALEQKGVNFQQVVQDARVLRTMLEFKGESL